MNLLHSGAIRQAFEAAADSRSFSMPQFYEQLTALAGVPFRQMIQPLATSLGERPAHHTLQGLMRSSFLIEPVLTRGGSTKMTCRWSTTLMDDARHAAFEECTRIFEALLIQLLPLLEEQEVQELLVGFAGHKLVSYEIPVDYVQRLTDSPIVPSLVYKCTQAGLFHAGQARIG
ncbi:MAG: hypothetical protein L6Q98_16085 [Anaerolineae bacterium]|nr:hypothetical protein [Anaerolineae bacterium]NUQ05990.1 hypothetical protein [Anaerolineae bacterium]